MDDKPKRLILIDGNAIIHRAYHALPPLTNKKGELLNAVYGFTSTILSVIDKFKPDYILAAFDLAGPTFRHKEFADYKATRVKADQDLYDQIPRVKEVTQTLGIPIFEKDGYEADDLIGTISKLSEENKLNGNIENIIVTGDLDTLQLVSEKTKVYTMRRGLTDSVLYDMEKIKERYNLKPEQLIDFKGLRGDLSDNIPGVKGIGEKTASELLQKYGTLENIYKNISEIKGAVKDKLERDKMQAIQSKKLATIVRNVPVGLELDRAKTHDFDRDKLVALFNELNFYSLIKRIPKQEGNKSKPNSWKFQESGFGNEYEIISKDKADEFLRTLKKQIEVSFVLGEDSVAFSWKTGRAAYIPNLKSRILKIKAILENKKISKIGYDLKSAIKTLKTNGIELKGELFDIMLAAYVLNPGEKNDFSRLVLTELKEEIEEDNKKGQLGLSIESQEEISAKICKKADYIFRLKKIYQEKIEKISQAQNKENNLKKIFDDMEMPLVKILAEMEIVGVKLNKIIFEGISKKIEARIKNLERNIYELAGTQFNVNSSRQLAKILFEKLKLPIEDIKKGKTGYSTASNELQKLKSEHKIIEKIEEYREIFKLKTTYLDTLPKLCDENSRIHTTFNQAVTATGRLSSSEPNLQNIPIKTDLGQLMRVAFEAEEGYKLVGADYSQIDLRVVAHVSGDKKLIDLFQRGEDIHRATAAEINKVSLSQVTEKMRSSAKALNFGIIYGMSVFGFSQSAGIERDDAKKFINEYMEKFTGVAEYIKSTKEFAKINGYVETEMGRRRYIPEINSPNFQVQNSGERMAINMPIQGMSADIMKLAMIKIQEEFFGSSTSSDLSDRERLNFHSEDKSVFNGVKMILQVHDEIILEVKEEIAKRVAVKVKEIIENAYKLRVPLVVSVKTGDNWGEI